MRNGTVTATDGDVDVKVDVWWCGRSLLGWRCRGGGACGWDFPGSCGGGFVPARIMERVDVLIVLWRRCAEEDVGFDCAGCDLRF